MGKNCMPVAPHQNHEEQPPVGPALPACPVPSTPVNPSPPPSLPPARRQLSPSPEQARPQEFRKLLQGATATVGIRAQARGPRPKLSTSVSPSQSPFPDVSSSVRVPEPRKTRGKGFLPPFHRRQMRSREGMGPAPHHTAPEWDGTAHPGPPGKGALGLCITELVEGPRGRAGPQGEVPGPTPRRLQLLPSTRRQETGFELSNHIENKCAAAPGRQCWSTQGTSPLSGL